MIPITFGSRVAETGNFPPRSDDRTHMDCYSAREAISAMMDGEDPAPDDPAATEAHVRACDGCRGWLDTVERIDRASRLEPAPEPVGDSALRVLAAVRLPRARRRIRALRVALCVTAVVQIALGLAGLAGSGGMSMHGMAMPVPEHMSHELVAFNVAFGVTLLVISARIERARTQVSTLTTFVAVLAVVSVADLASGEVGWARLATHAPIVVGLILTVCAAREPVAPTGPESPMNTGGGCTRTRLSTEAVLRHAGGPPPWSAASELEEHRVA